MKYVFGLLLGVLLGAVLGLVLILNNPLASTELSGQSAASSIVLPVAGQGTATVVQSGTGYPWLGIAPSDAKRPDIAGMKSAITVLLSTESGSRDVVYLTRVRALDGNAKPLFGQVRETSLWHVVVPGKGSFAVYSEDNIWPLIDALLVPFARGESWAGDVRFTSTTGPIGPRARVIGLSGEFSGRTGSARLDQEIRSASAKMGITDERAMLMVDLDPLPVDEFADELDENERLEEGD